MFKYPFIQIYCHSFVQPTIYHTFQYIYNMHNYNLPDAPCLPEGRYPLSYESDLRIANIENFAIERKHKLKLDGIITDLLIYICRKITAVW